MYLLLWECCTYDIKIRPLKFIPFRVCNRWRSSWRKRSLFQKALLGLTILMYCLSTVHIALSLRQSLVAFFEEDATRGGLTTFNNPGSYFLITQTSLELVNVSSLFLISFFVNFEALFSAYSGTRLSYGVHGFYGEEAGEFSPYR